MRVEWGVIRGPRAARRQPVPGVRAAIHRGWTLRPAVHDAIRRLQYVMYGIQYACPRASLCVSFALGLFAASPFAAAAQDGGGSPLDSAGPAASEGREDPPWVGEELKYRIKYGIFGIGEGSIGVPGIDTIDGRTTYAAEMRIKGGIPGYRIDQKIYSWIDTEKLFSRRFVKDEENRPREYEFRAEQRLVHQIRDRDTTWTIPTSEPLDDLSIVFLARTLPLKVGETYTFNRYFKEENNPIILKVLRRDRRKVGAGEFNTIVVQPVIPESSLYSEGGDAEIHLSDDERRLVVYMKVDVLLLNLTLHLEEFEEGGALEDVGGAEGPGDGDDVSGSSPENGPPETSRREPFPSTRSSGPSPAATRPSGSETASSAG